MKNVLLNQNLYCYFYLCRPFVFFVKLNLILSLSFVMNFYVKFDVDEWPFWVALDSLPWFVFCYDPYILLLLIFNIYVFDAPIFWHTPSIEWHFRICYIKLAILSISGSPWKFNTAISLNIFFTWPVKYFWPLSKLIISLYSV